MNGELFSEMSSRDLQNAAQRTTLNIPGQRTSGENFWLSTNAVTRGTAHSSGAAGKA